MIGYESSRNHVYGYAQDLVTIYVTDDDGVTWYAVDKAVLADDKVLSTWTSAIHVPETSDSTLTGATPHSSYTQNSWGGKFGAYSLFSEITL